MRSTVLLSIIMLLNVVFVLPSCNNSAQVLFLVNTEVDRVVPGGLNLVETHFFQINNVPTFWESFSQNSAMGNGENNEVFPNQAILSSKFGDNLDFINNVSIWLYNTDYEGGTEIFYQDNINLGNKTEIELLSGIAEIGDIVKADQMLIEIRLNFRQFKASETELRLKMDFAVVEAE